MASTMDAAEIIQAILDAKEAGDEERRRALIDPEVLFISTAFAPFELRGRDAFIRFIDSLHDIYVAPRTDEYLGIEAFSPSMAALKNRVTIGDVSGVSVMFFMTKDGRVAEIIDVVEDRGRPVAALLDPAALAAALASPTG